MTPEEEAEDYLFVKSEALAGRALLRLSTQLLISLAKAQVLSQRMALSIFDDAMIDMPPEDLYGLPGAFLHDLWQKARTHLEEQTRPASDPEPG